MSDKARPEASCAMQHFWASRSQRERALMGVTAAGVVLAALLALAILPAWRVLKAAPQAQVRLDAQWQRMQELQAQSAALLKQPQRAFNEAALRASLAPLGASAQLHMGQASAELQLQNAAPDALALWLLSSRSETGTVVREAQLQRSPATTPSGISGASVQGEPSSWSGRLLLDLPR